MNQCSERAVEHEQSITGAQEHKLTAIRDGGQRARDRRRPRARARAWLVEEGTLLGPTWRRALTVVVTRLAGGVVERAATQEVVLGA